MISPMGFSWKMGRVAGIDLFLHPTFLVLVAWTYASEGANFALFMTAIFGCVMLHEFGHALAARALGIPTRSITLYFFGGIARLERMPRAPGAELLITLAGPLVNVAIGLALGLALWVDGALRPGAEWIPLTLFASNLMLVNFLLAAFNMVPAFPMDGGRILRALLTVKIGRARATAIAAKVGQVLAVAFGAYSIASATKSGGIPWAQVLLAAFIYYAAGVELAQARDDEVERRGGSGDGVWTAPPGYRWVQQGQGFWQLAPIHAHAASWEHRPWR